jgi:hypothetical protein
MRARLTDFTTIHPLAPALPRLRRRIETGPSMVTLLYVVATFFVALLLGIGSARYMVERGSPLTTAVAGPWSSWVYEGNPSADLYTKAHLASSGRLPLTSTMARYFLAGTDSQGEPLVSSCEYSISGTPLNARWWSLALYDEGGSIIKNPSGRYSFNSEEAVRRADGTYHVTLARHARPENWLPSGADDQGLVLMLRIYGPRDTDASGTGIIMPASLPAIERQACE